MVHHPTCLALLLRSSFMTRVSSTKTLVTYGKRCFSSQSPSITEGNAGLDASLQPKARNDSWFDYSRTPNTRANSYSKHYTSREKPFKSSRNASHGSLRHATAVRLGSVLADHLQAAGEKIPQGPWITVKNVPPTSSLDAMIMGIQKSLQDAELQRGIVDLDAVWEPSEPIPFLPARQWDSDNTTDDAPSQVVRKAYMILSSFGRLCGWHMQLDNRSLAHALLSQPRDNPVRCAWKDVRIEPYTGREEDISIYNVSDATVRVENCPEWTSLMHLINIFSRYDLKPSGTPIVQWHIQRHDKTNVPRTFLVHFADASWARAAVREQQSCLLKGKELRLAQFPRQLL